MKVVVMTGASGVVGSKALQHLLQREDVGQVVALGRRALDLQHPKLTSRVVDLQRAEEMAAHIPEGAFAALCCLGTTMKKAGSKEAFRAVDKDAVLAFGEAARSRGVGRFGLVSALGANAGSLSFYAKTKGEAEQGLARLGLGRLVVLRPSLIDDQGGRGEERLGERVGLAVSRVLFGVVGKTSRYAPVSADTIARALVRLTLDEDGAGLHVIESEQIHRHGA